MSRPGRFPTRMFWAWLFDALDRRGALVLAAFLAVYPLLFEGLNSAIYAAEDADLVGLADALAAVRGFVPARRS